MTKKESSTVQKSRLKSNDKQLCWAKPCRSSMFTGKLEDEIIGLQSSLQVPGKEELSFANTVLFTLCFHLKRRDGRREGRDTFIYVWGYPGEHVYGITLSLTSTFHLLCWQFKDGRM